MQSVQLHGPRDLRLTEFVESRDPGAGEVRIQVNAVGICGSDLHLYEQGHIGGIGANGPFCPGHEFMGTVIEVGSDARDGLNILLREGIRVAVDPQVSCHECEWCENGNPNLCPHHTFFGLPPRDGALRETMIVPARNCFSIPDSISDAGGTLLETLGVCLHALDLSKPRVGASVGVIGCGPVGLLLVRLAALAGYDPVIAIDPIRERAEFAKGWGATHALPDSAESAIAAVEEITFGRGCDRVIEAAWAGPTVDAAVSMACPGARIVLVGIPPDHDLHLNHSVARRKGLSLILARRMKHTYPRAIQLASGPKPRIDLDQLATHHFPMEKTPEAFDANLRYIPGMLKAIIHP